MGTVGPSVISTVAEMMLGLGANTKQGRPLATKVSSGTLQDTESDVPRGGDGWSRASSGLGWLNVG